MPSLWPVAILLVVGLALVLLYAFGPRAFGGFQYPARAFWCPYRQRNVRVRFAESAWDGRIVDVARCSAFAPATDVTCDKACTTLRMLPPRR